MALILETGEGLPDAETLVGLDEVRAFASSRGRLVSDDDTVLEPQVRIAHDYLLANENRLMGCRAVEGQALPYPRSGLYVLGFSVDDDVIPQAVKNAVCQLVIEGLDRDLLPSQDARVVIQEAVGPISTTYANSGTTTANPVLPRVEAFLGPLLKNQGYSLRSERA